MKKIILVIFNIVFFMGCYNCDDVKKHCETLSCRFKVSEKSRDKYIDFKGFDKKNNIVDFEEFEYWNIYDSVELGDSLIKELGKSEIKLIKKDTILVFPLMCEGRVVE